MEDYCVHGVSLKVACQQWFDDELDALRQENATLKAEIERLNVDREWRGRVLMKEHT